MTLLELLSLCFGAEYPHFSITKIFPKHFLKKKKKKRCAKLLVLQTKTFHKEESLVISGNCSLIAQPSANSLIWATLRH